MKLRDDGNNQNNLSQNNIYSNYPNYNNAGNNNSSYNNSNYSNQNYNNSGYSYYNTNNNNNFNQPYYNYNNQNSGYSYNDGYYSPASASYSNEARISDTRFNLILGGCLLWGFIINCILCSALSDAIFSIATNNFLMFFISYIILVFIGTSLVNKSDNPAISFIGYNLIVIPIGMIISMSLTIYVSAGYAEIIPVAFGITAAVTLTMMVLSSIFPAFFASNTMGKTLWITLLVTIVIEFILFLLGFSLSIIDYIVVLIFCGYIGYDWAVANQGAKTVDRAVDTAAALYVDIANLFLRILRILARARR